MNLTEKKIYNTLKDVKELLSSRDYELKQWTLDYFDFQHKRITQDIQICSSLYKEGNKMLDVGCAPFYTTMSLARLNLNIVGVDIAPERFSEILSQVDLEVRKCNFETEPLPFEDHEFDMILLSEVFEHLRIDLISTFQEIRRVLKPGGLLLLSTPNFFELNNLLHLLLKGEGGGSDIYSEYNKLHTIGHMGHVREYTSKAVIKFAGNLGFHHEKTIYRGKKELSLNPINLFIRVCQSFIPITRSWFLLILRRGTIQSL